MIDFTRGQLYLKAAIRLALGGGNVQSGILYAPRNPSVVAIFNSDQGKKVGYMNQAYADGTWHYYGQGSTGDQSLERAANRILRHASTVLLFEKASGSQFRFRGNFEVSGTDWDVPESGTRKGNRLLRFKLRPVSP